MIKEKAKEFAIKAHKGQVRKNEPDKPMVIHPIEVANILSAYGYDDNVIAAAYLHDVVEDTEYTIDDIKSEFNDDIAALVYAASEPDKSLSWEERKQHTIDITRTLNFRKKLIICADKISNLEDLKNTFEKNRKKDFSLFKRGEREQKWYYENVYESLIFNEDSNEPIFVRLRDVIDWLFNEKKDDFLESTIFVNDLDYYEELKVLHAKKCEVMKMKNVSCKRKPFIIEFTGTPRTGKTSIINNLYDFFKKGGYSVKIVEEFTTSNIYKTEFFPAHKHLTNIDLNIAILEETCKQLEMVANENFDIVLIDRSLNDRSIWNHRRLLTNDIDKKSFDRLIEKYSEISKSLIDVLVIGYTDSLTSLKRDYVNTLALEKRNFLNIRNVDEYNKSLMACKIYFEKSVKKIVDVDTTLISTRDSSLIITNEILDFFREEFILDLNNLYQQ